MPWLRRDLPKRRSTATWFSTLSGLQPGGHRNHRLPVETASADGTSSMAITFYEDRAGTMQVSATDTCAYTVEPNGRVTLGSATQLRQQPSRVLLGGFEHGLHR